MKVGTLKIKKNRIGPRILPLTARDVPIPTANTRSVPKISESPIPLKGPINAAFTALIDDASKSSFALLISSIASVIPPMKGET